MCCRQTRCALRHVFHAGYFVRTPRLVLLILLLKPCGFLQHMNKLSIRSLDRRKHYCTGLVLIGLWSCPNFPDVSLWFGRGRG